MIGSTSPLLNIVFLAALAFQVYALVDAAIRPAGLYVAAGKLTKPAWVAILAVALVGVSLTGILGIFGLAAMVATIVYFVDVRPALLRVSGR